MFVHCPKLHFFRIFRALWCYSRMLFNKNVHRQSSDVSEMGFLCPRFQFKKWIEPLNTILSHSSFDKFMVIFQSWVQYPLHIQRPKPKLPNFWKTRFITIYLSQTTRTGGSYITSYYHMHNQQKYHDIPTKTISQENYVIFRRWFSTMS